MCHKPWYYDGVAGHWSSMTSKYWLTFFRVDLQLMAQFESGVEPVQLYPSMSPCMCGSSQLGWCKGPCWPSTTRSHPYTDWHRLIYTRCCGGLKKAVWGWGGGVYAWGKNTRSNQAWEEWWAQWWCACHILTAPSRPPSIIPSFPEPTNPVGVAGALLDGRENISPYHETSSLLLSRTGYSTGCIIWLCQCSLVLQLIHSSVQNLLQGQWCEPTTLSKNWLSYSFKWSRYSFVHTSLVLSKARLCAQKQHTQNIGLGQTCKIMLRWTSQSQLKMYKQTNRTYKYVLLYIYPK